MQATPHDRVWSARFDSAASPLALDARPHRGVVSKAKRPRCCKHPGAVIDSGAVEAPPMTKPYHRPEGERKPASRPPPDARGNLRCLDCARARREGRDHGCLVHVAEDVFP